MLSLTKHLASACALALLPILPMSLLAPSPAVAQVSIGISVNIAPPILPVYVQPALPAPGYIWTPGYWAWDPVVADYFWVPGAWVTPPRVGLLWTPGYWGWGNGVYFFHTGYWGPRIGFYGGVNYGFGYFGNGYSGGHWIGNSFAYNTAVNHVNPAVVNHSYAESVAGQGSRGVISYSAASRSTVVSHTLSQPQSQVRVVSKPATPATAERSSDPPPVASPVPVPAKVNPPATAAKTPAPSAPAKTSHASSTAAAPLK